MNNQVIGIIAANNIRYSPYIRYYTNILDKLGMEYELIYPNRNGVEDSWIGITHELEWDKKKKSIINYYLYSKKVKRLIKERKYDKLIVLTTNNAVFLSVWISIKYKNRYIVDIRDYTYENNVFFYALEKIALNNALLRVVSSNKFKVFLPKQIYQVCHNISYASNTRNDRFAKHDCPIIIGYLGSVGYVNQVEALIKLVKNDFRFCFYIYGNGPASERIDELVKQCNCDRIKYFGGYLPEEKQDLVCGIDILFNVYGNDSLLLTCALSNKLYDAMYYHKLLLNSPGTYMEEMASICGFSIDFNTSTSLDGLFDWYNQCDEMEIDKYQNELLLQFTNENQETEKMIMDVLRK